MNNNYEASQKSDENFIIIKVQTVVAAAAKSECKELNSFKLFASDSNLSRDSIPFFSISSWKYILKGLEFDFATRSFSAPSLKMEYFFFFFVKIESLSTIRAPI